MVKKYSCTILFQQHFIMCLMTILWINREHLVSGFFNGVIDQKNIIPMPGYDGEGGAKWLDNERDICNALDYMRGLLQRRESTLSECNEPG